MTTDIRKVAHGSALRLTNLLAEVIVALVLMPFIIHHLGDRMYGLWSVLVSFLGLYTMLDLGLSSATVRYVSRALGTQDEAEANRVFNTSFAIFFFLGLVGVIVTAGAAVLAPVLFHDVEDIGLFRILVVIMGLNAAINLPMRVFLGVLNANLRYDLRAGVGLLKVAVRTVLVVVLLGRGHGIIALALITLGVAMLGHALHYLLAMRIAPYLSLSPSIVRRDKIRSLFVYSSYTFVGRVADRLRFGVQNFVIAGFMGLSSVTIYTIASRLINYFIDVVESAVGMTFPIFSRLEGRNDYNSLRKTFVFSTKISGYLAIMIGASVIIFGHDFIERWMGVDYLSAFPLLVVLTVPVTIALMQNPTIGLLFGTSRHKFFAITNVIEGVTNLLLCLLLVKRYGLLGVAWGTAIPMLIVKLFVQPVYSCRSINLPVLEYYGRVLIPTMLKSLAFFVPFWLLFDRHITPDYFVMGGIAAGQCILYAVIVFFVGFNKTERAFFRRLLTRNA